MNNKEWHKQFSQIKQNLKGKDDNMLKHFEYLETKIVI
jgi:hypothetical protein